MLVHLQASHFPQFSERRHPVHSPQRLEDFFSTLGCSQGASYSYRCPPSFSLYFLCFLSSWSVLRGLYRVIKVESSSLQRYIKKMIINYIYSLFLYYFDEKCQKTYNTEKLLNMFCIFFSYIYAITMVPLLACVASSEII